MNKFLVVFGCMFLLVVIVSAESNPLDLSGVWTTQKGALLTCDSETCVMTQPSENKNDQKRLGMTVLKEFTVNDKGKGSAKLIHPTKDDKFLDVAVQLGEQDLALTLSFWGRSTTATWTRTPVE